MNFLPTQLAYSLEAEFFHTEAGEGAAVDHGLPQCGVVEFSRFGDMPHEATGKSVACAGRVEGIFQWKSGRPEELIATDHDRAVLALLDDDDSGPHLANLACRFNEIGLARQLPRLRIIHQQHVNAF